MPFIPSRNHYTCTENRRSIRLQKGDEDYQIFSLIITKK